MIFGKKTAPGAEKPAAPPPAPAPAISREAVALAESIVAWARDDLCHSAGAAEKLRERFAEALQQLPEKVEVPHEHAE